MSVVLLLQGSIGMELLLQTIVYIRVILFFVEMTSYVHHDSITQCFTAFNLPLPYFLDLLHSINLLQLLILFAVSVVFPLQHMVWVEPE